MKLMYQLTVSIPDAADEYDDVIEAIQTAIEDDLPTTVYCDDDAGAEQEVALTIEMSYLP